MKWQAVESSNVAAVAYEDETRTLHVKFKSGATYTYHGVTRDKADALVDAKSVGKHLHQHIRPHHKATRL